MREWLPENFTPPAGRASEIAKIAVKRGKARKRNEKIALSFCSFLFVAAFSFMTVQNFHETAPSTFPPLAKGDQGGFDGMVVENPSPALPLPKGEGASAPAPLPVGAIHESPAVQTETVDNRPRAIPELPLQFSRVDHSVAINWEGQGKFAVYKCDSPKFDSCSIMEVVEGNSYLDKEENSGKIVYYRIEPLTKRG